MNQLTGVLISGPWSASFYFFLFVNIYMRDRLHMAEWLSDKSPAVNFTYGSTGQLQSYGDWAVLRCLLAKIWINLASKGGSPYLQRGPVTWATGGELRWGVEERQKKVLISKSNRWAKLYLKKESDGNSVVIIFQFILLWQRDLFLMTDSGLRSCPNLSKYSLSWLCPKVSDVKQLFPSSQRLDCRAFPNVMFDPISQEWRTTEMCFDKTCFKTLIKSHTYFYEEYQVFNTS